MFIFFFFDESNQIKFSKRGRFNSCDAISASLKKMLLNQTREKKTTIQTFCNRIFGIF